MTAKREIQQWLKDGMPIRAGISLYEKYGNNPNIRRRILTVQDKRILRSILDNELRIIAGISVLPAPQKQRPSKKRIKPAENPAAIPTVVPDTQSSVTAMMLLPGPQWLPGYWICGMRSINAGSR